MSDKGVYEDQNIIYDQTIGLRQGATRFRQTIGADASNMFLLMSDLSLLPLTCFIQLLEEKCLYLENTLFLFCCCWFD